jgi:hypothetical protein
MGFLYLGIRSFWGQSPEPGITAVHECRKTHFPADLACDAFKPWDIEKYFR